MWSLSERDAVDKGLAPHSPLRTALEKFCEAQAEARRRDCAECMRSAPRQYELASDYAAKADVYDSLLKQLDLLLEQE